MRLRLGRIPARFLTPFITGREETRFFFSFMPITMTC